MTAASGVILDHLVAALGAATVHHDPWPHCYLTASLPAATITELQSTFGSVPMQLVHRREGNPKDYRMLTRRIHPADGCRLPSSAWTAMIAALADHRYRNALTQLAGVDISSANCTIDLWQYGEGDWLGPHVDKPQKVVTQLFYLGNDWHPDAGGHLLILDTQDGCAPCERLAPVPGASAILVRSDESWHAVECGKSSASLRRSIAVTFWNDNPVHGSDR